jgi:prephenate dehydratase
MTSTEIQNPPSGTLWYGARRFAAGETGAGASANNMKVAIQGEPGAFSHEAALKFDADAAIAPYSLSADVFAALDEGRVDAAVIPIENSLAGSVLEHFDLLLKYDVRVERETLLRIRHNLIVVPGTKISQLERVYSHPIALAQCRQFFATHTEMEALAFYDTAGSVKHIMEQQDRHTAAIASQRAAEVYGAQILQQDLQDNLENYTRFFLVKRTADVVQAADANKISIAFSVENRPGSLVAALNALSTLGTNLTKIESRPVHGRPWEYVFYVDCQIRAAEEGTAALDALGKHCAMVKELGRYREALKSVEQIQG